MRHGTPVQPSERSRGSGLPGIGEGREDLCRALWIVADQEHIATRFEGGSGPIGVAAGTRRG